MKYKQIYYVSINKQSVTETSVSDVDQYEIYATQEEADALRQLLLENENEEMAEAARNILLNPLANEETKYLRDGGDEGLLHLYRLVYKYGTEETKEKIESLGIV